MDKEQYDIVKGAMDIHARNTAILFAKWICDLGGDNQLTLIDNNWYFERDTDGDIKITEDNLYEWFLRDILNPIETVNS